MYRIIPVKLVPKIANSATPDRLLGRLLHSNELQFAGLSAKHDKKEHITRTQHFWPSMRCFVKIVQRQFKRLPAQFRVHGEAPVNKF